jgi:hypothetical protein
MVENHAGPDDLLDTTDCLEAVGVFKGWKNFFFIVVVLCLLLLQICFFLVDRGAIEIGERVYGDEPAAVEHPAVEHPTVEHPGEPPQEPLEPAGQEDMPVVALPDEDEAIEQEPPEEVIVEPNEPGEPNEPSEPDESGETNGPAEVNEPAEPNETTESITKAQAPKLQLAAGWVPAGFLSKVTFEQLAWMIRLANAVLVLTATLYCLTLLFGLKVSMHGRLGGINHISRAFFLSLIMLVLLLPWQRIFGGVVAGAIYTPDELVECYFGKTNDILDIVLYYLRFSGYSVLILLLLVLSQLRSLRWAKAILRRLEII